jgi:hypothetical protein
LQILSIEISGNTRLQDEPFIAGPARDLLAIEELE